MQPTVDSALGQALLKLATVRSGTPDPTKSGVPETIPVTTMWGRMHGKKLKTQDELLSHLRKKLGPGGIKQVNGVPSFVPDSPDETTVPLLMRKGKHTYMKAHLVRQVERRARRRGLLPPKEKEAQAPAAAEAVMNAWSRLPSPVKGALVGAPIGALTTGVGEGMLNRRLDDGSSAAQHLYGSMADRTRRMRDASDDPGMLRKLLAESGGYAENLADITTEHPVKSALIAALLGGALGAGVGAGTGATLRMLPEAASAVR